MINDKYLHKLHQIVLPDFDVLKNNIILEDENGYIVFEKYFVKINENVVNVTRHGQDIGNFTSSRIALSWCIADKYNQERLARDIKNIDLQRRCLLEDVRVRKQIAKKCSDSERRETMFLKVSSKQIILSRLNHQIDKCVNLAKYWQIRGFDNEIARIKRTQPLRTNR